jgi:hypothetical protein
VNEEGLGQQSAVNSRYLGWPSTTDEGLGHQSAVNLRYLGEPSANEEGLGQQCVVWRTSTTFNENGAASVRPSAEADNLDRIVHGQYAVSLGGDENTWTESVWTETPTGKLEWTTAGQCVVSNGGDDGASKKWRSAEAGSSSNELEQTAHNRRVVATSAVSVVLSLVPLVETGERAVATPGATTLSHLPSVKTDTSTGERDQTMVDQFVVTNSEGDGARPTIKVEKLSSKLNRTDLDQCVVSNEAEDEALKKLESAEADTSPGELARTVHGWCVIAGRVVNIGEAATLWTPVEAGDLTGTATEPQINTIDVGLPWISSDGRAMKMADWSRAGLSLQLFWRIGVGWLDEIVSLLAERWKDEVSRMPPLQLRGCKQRPRTIGRQIRTGVDDGQGVVGAVSFNDEKRTIVLRTKRRSTVTHDRVGNVEPTLGGVLRNCATPWLNIGRVATLIIFIT